MLWKLRLAAVPALAFGLLAPQAALGAGAGSFGSTGSMGTPRYAAVAAPLKDGRVVVAGGYYDDGGGDHYLASAEVFDPATNSFSSAGIGAMGTPRRGAVAAPLPDGRVLVAGGSYYDGGDHYLASAEVFDPATNAFTAVGEMGIARVRAAAAPLPDGRVLVAGGNDGPTRLSSAEVFNPATNTFTAVNDMGTDRARAAAAPLPDGRVLLAGGTNGAPLSSAEVFDPATNSFSSAGIGAMGTARQAPTAARLPDGRVLVSGGVYDEGAWWLSRERRGLRPCLQLVQLGGYRRHGHRPHRGRSGAAPGRAGAGRRRLRWAHPLLDRGDLRRHQHLQLRGQGEKAPGQRSGRRQGLGERCGRSAQCLGGQEEAAAPPEVI